MKKLILAITTISILSLACNKAKTTTEPQTNTKDVKTRALDDVDNLEFKKYVQIFNEQGTEHIDAVISAHSETVLLDYLDKITLIYTPCSVPEYSGTQMTTGTEEATDFENDVRINLMDENISGAYQISHKKTRAEGSGYAYHEEFCSNCNGAQVNWIYTANNNPDLTWTFRWRNCGLCGYNGPLVSILGAANTWSSYWVSSQKIKIKIHTNWWNSNHTFWN